jgi:hypothetical protein
LARTRGWCVHAVGALDAFRWRRHDTDQHVDKRVQLRPGNLGFSGAEGAFRALKRALRLCRSSRPRLERGGRRKQRAINRGPRLYHDLPGDRQRNPSNHAPSAPPGQTGLRYATGIPSCGRTRRADSSWGLPERSARVRASRCRPVVVRRSCPPTQVTGRNPPLLRFRQRRFACCHPLFRTAGGAEQHLT